MIIRGKAIQEAIPMPEGVDVIQWDVMHQMEEDIQGMIT